MRNKKRITLYFNPKVWKGFQNVCTTLEEVPSKRIEEFMKREISMLKMLSFLNKEIKESKKEK